MSVSRKWATYSDDDSLEREKRMAKWDFSCIDNGGKRQAFTIVADDKTTAIRTALEKARKSAKGDITNWNCKLNPIR